MYFFESSALVKLFVQEQGSSTMIELAESVEDRLKTASALAPVEVRSALRKRERMGLATAAETSSAVRIASDERRHMIEYQISSLVLAQASTMIDKHHLRALDAIQLATAMVVRDTNQLQSDVIFVCADEALLAAAEREGLQTLYPK